MSKLTRSHFAGVLATLSIVASCATPDARANTTEREAGVTARTAEQRSPAGLDEIASAVQAGELERALADIATVLAASDASSARAQALSWRGHIHTLRREPEAAIEAYRAALSESPDAPWLHYALGTALHTIGAFDDAVLSYSQAIRLDARHVKAFQWRGFTYELLGNPEGAIADYTVALELIEAASDDVLRSWGAERGELLRWTLAQRAIAYDAAGQSEAAIVDRDRLERSD